MTSANSSASSIFVTTLEGITGSPMDSSISLNNCLSSALSMVSGVAPKSFTFCSSRKPDLASCMERVSAVCPPMVGRMLSGFSNLIIFFNTAIVSGSIYTLSAIVLSVIMVAGLELTKTTSIPSSFRVRQTCVPA